MHSITEVSMAAKLGRCQSTFRQPHILDFDAAGEGTLLHNRGTSSIDQKHRSMYLRLSQSGASAAPKSSSTSSRSLTSRHGMRMMSTNHSRCSRGELMVARDGTGSSKDRTTPRSGCTGRVPTNPWTTHGGVLRGRSMSSRS